MVDIIFTQTSPSQWVLTVAGGAPGDSLTLNSTPGTEPEGEGDLRQQLLTGTEYTPPANGQPAQWNLGCFTPRARIETPQGLRAIGNLRVGDLVLTADAGMQPVMAILQSRYDAATIRKIATLRPVIIDKGAFGAGLPLRRMAVSRQHAFALQQGKSLIRALYLSETLPGVWIQRARPNPVRYIHLLLEAHHLVHVKGVWTETFYSNPAACADLPAMAAGPCTTLHTCRCRPLLSRANMRRARPHLDDIGRLPLQLTPSTRPETPAACAPEGVRP
jgi:hypothetical protein